MSAPLGLSVGIVFLSVLVLLMQHRNVPPHAARESVPERVPDLNQAQIEITNLLSSEEAGVSPFVSARILKNGARLEITVTDAWYGFEPYMKERLIETLSKTYAAIACKHGLRKKCDASDNPETSIVDTFGKEVAHASSFGNTKVLR